MDFLFGRPYGKPFAVVLPRKPFCLLLIDKVPLCQSLLEYLEPKLLLPSKSSTPSIFPLNATCERRQEVGFGCLCD
ncbi:hypothetical protein HUJ04_010695 [Dendroctonus ponderosae]|nr:hypothetical protein HUJ04_010695 [Dendroctonus ponderosae]